MPKVVDQEQRREDIVRAFGRVVRREGLAGASVRAVAAEANLSPGALRHYFDRQDGLIHFAAASMYQQVALRVQAVRSELGDGDGLAVLEELMPLDERRRDEFDVWLALVVAGASDPALATISRESHEGIARVCRDALIRAGVKEPSPDQVRDIHAVVDGLSLHLSLYPDTMTPATARRILRERFSECAG